MRYEDQGNGNLRVFFEPTDNVELTLITMAMYAYAIAQPEGVGALEYVRDRMANPEGDFPDFRENIRRDYAGNPTGLTISEYVRGRRVPLTISRQPDLAKIAEGKIDALTEHWYFNGYAYSQIVGSAAFLRGEIADPVRFLDDIITILGEKNE